MPQWFDDSQAPTERRKICFAAAARDKVFFNISDTIADLCEPYEPLSATESNIVQRIGKLIAPDAPLWVSEMDGVIQQLPSHLCAALPPSLRTGRFEDSDPQTNAIKGFSTVEQIQAFIQNTLDRQFERLSKRWTLPIISIETQRPSKRKVRRTRDKLRIERDRMIAEIDDISPTMNEFITIMDERDVRPQPSWSGWPGSWTKAYKDPRLRRLIHQDKSRALARARKK